MSPVWASTEEATLALRVRFGGTSKELRLASIAGNTADGTRTGAAAPRRCTASALQGRKGQPANCVFVHPWLVAHKRFTMFSLCKKWRRRV